MPVGGLDYVAPAVRTMRNFFGRYGTVGASIRGIWNGIIPVAVVDRYRDDTEGSLFGLTATAQCIPGTSPAFAMGSGTDDWELHSLSWGLFYTINPAADERVNLMVYTPDFTYTPVQVPSPAGIFVAGLNTDFAFTLGSVSAVAGYNVGLPTRFGAFPFTTLTLRNFAGAPSSNVQNLEVAFDPPIRVYRDVTLGFLQVEPSTVAVDVTISAKYTIRPRTTTGPRTG